MAEALLEEPGQQAGGSGHRDSARDVCRSDYVVQPEPGECVVASYQLSMVVDNNGAADLIVMEGEGDVVVVLALVVNGLVFCGVGGVSCVASSQTHLATTCC